MPSFASIRQENPFWLKVANLSVLAQGAYDKCNLASVFTLSESRKKHFKLSLKNMLLIPVLPLVGYYGLDATGITELLVHHNPVLFRIMGEGFGHAGLCFSLHYVINACKHLWIGIVGKVDQQHTNCC